MKGLLARLKRGLRSYRQRYFPDEQTRAYHCWIARRLNERSLHRSLFISPGLFSVITAVWDGTPTRFFGALAETLRRQPCEWVICDNGCRRPELVDLLASLRDRDGVQIVGNGKNEGIAGGLLQCLRAATGRYIVPVDADDDLYPDSLAFAAYFIAEHDYPPLLYSDEDKVAGTRSSQPYFKPDFDPVLLSNSAYTAHLCFVHRERALQLGAYTDSEAEGSVDWDLFLRFVSAGHHPVHIPEVLYRWRIHPESTAEDSGAKNYIGRSQRRALWGFLSRHPAGADFEVVESPLLPGGAHFRLLRSSSAEPLPHVVLDPAELADPLPRDVRFVFVSASPVPREWILEASGIFELFPETVAVGGRLLGPSGKVIDADRHFGFAGGCLSPNAGRSIYDPGYFGQAFKQRSTTTVSTRAVAVDRDFLESLLAKSPLTPYSLGAKALGEGRRVVYSPYIAASVPEHVGAVESAPVQVVPDRRYYPEPFSLVRPFYID